METTHQAIIKEIVSTLLQKMGFEVPDVSIEKAGEDAFVCKVRVDQDQNLLIGQYGVNLAAIQHLIRIMLRKRTDEKCSVVVDINDYFSGKRVLLEKEAGAAAQEALRGGAAVTLRPMLSYERKVIHTFLAEDPAVITESSGQGNERRIIVRPKADAAASL